MTNDYRDYVFLILVDSFFLNKLAFHPKSPISNNENNTESTVFSPVFFIKTYI